MPEKFTLALQDLPESPAAQPDSALMPLEQIEMEIKARAGMITENIIIIGKMLIDVKGRLEPGQFMNWLRDKVSFSQSTANNFMRIAREAPKTPSLAGLPYTKMLALLDVPEPEREQFAKDNKIDDKSAREIQRLIKEKEDAEKARQAAEAGAKAIAEQLDTQRQIAQRQQDLAEQYNQKYYQEVENTALLESKLSALQAAEPKTIEVEIQPADYEELKARAAEAEQYAMQQENERRRLQTELRKLQETRADMPLQGDGPLSIEAFSNSIKDFMGKVGLAPNMAPFFRAMGPDTLHAYGQWLDVLADWMDGTRKAISEGTHYVDVAESAVV